MLLDALELNFALLAVKAFCLHIMYWFHKFFKTLLHNKPSL